MAHAVGVIWEEQKLQIDDEEASAPRLTMIMISNAFSSEGSRFPFDELPSRSKTAELPKRILVLVVLDTARQKDLGALLQVLLHELTLFSESGAVENSQNDCDHQEENECFKRQGAQLAQDEKRDSFRLV